jgi:outer membrane protein TolC
VLSRAKTLAAHDLRTRSLEAELSRVRQLHDVGRAAPVEILRVEAALAAAEAERVDVAAQLDVAERALARLTALPNDQTTSGHLSDVSLRASETPQREQVMTTATEASPLVQQMRSRVAAQRAAIAFARAGRHPQLQAVGTFTEFGSSKGFVTGEWNAGMQLRMSLFDGGATSARVARAKAQATAAEEQLRVAERDVHDAVDRALADLTQALATADSLQKAVERFSEVTRIEKLRLENGVGTQTDYLRAEADLLQARAGLSAARYRAMLTRVELTRISGTLDAGWMAKTFRSGT